jgi:heme exporter protein D
MTLGPYAVFIVSAYATALVVIVGLIVWVAADYAAQKRVLGELEARGVKRRSKRK